MKKRFEMVDSDFSLRINMVFWTQSSRWDDSFAFFLPGDESPDYSHVRPLRGITRVIKLALMPLMGED